MIFWFYMIVSIVSVLNEGSGIICEEIPTDGGQEKSQAWFFINGEFIFDILS